MSEAEKPKRRWFHFHLSTALLLMIGIGMFSGLNLIPREAKGMWGYVSYKYGWPMGVWLVVYINGQREGVTQTVPVDAAFVDIGIALVSLYLIVRFNEWLIRRREARKT